MRCYYRLELINRDDQLDLQDKRQTIQSTIQDARDAMAGLQRCDIVAVEQHAITLRVEEPHSEWHGLVGRTLANKHNMRYYCDPANQGRMFNCHRRPSPT